MVKSLAVMGITDSDFPMSSMTGRASLLLTTSTGGGVHAGIKKAIRRVSLYHYSVDLRCQCSRVLRNTTSG
ncbi:hypothetical protein AV903_16865 [Erwinia tracheiphila]|uniref:Uncharacterized protein n=1 Tax=Erwinia tracheiphila TaxID=65700 RepID=A0A345CV63_9GAMM|nr:hypothetical protein AV903_16865 [Erwinia tracheiphila]